MVNVVSESLPVVARADGTPGPAQGGWTYADYAALPEDGRRYEVVQGVLYMAPSPNRDHQTTLLSLAFQLVVHVQHAGLGRVFVAPFDVELAAGVVVQPDVIVVLAAHLDRITPSRIVGAPDLVVEVLSPGTAGYDRREKQDAYARARVREYWLADPSSRSVEPLSLEGASYRSLGVFTGTARLPSLVLPGFPIRVEQFFA